MESIVSHRRILFVSQNCYFDDSNGAAVASRAMMETLARGGFDTIVLTGTHLETGNEVDLSRHLAHHDLDTIANGGGSWMADPSGLRPETPPHQRLKHNNVNIVLHSRPPLSSTFCADTENQSFLRLFDSVVASFRPDVVVNYGGDVLAQEIRIRSRRNGSLVLFALHNFNYSSIDAFAYVDDVIIPSSFAADYYRRALGVNCSVIPNLVNFHRACSATYEGRFVTFVNPSYEKGVYAFARIADELGRRRPDIPLLVVEGRGSERTLADCGLDLRVHGNVSLMAHTPDPKHFWSVTRICVMPSLWWEMQPLVAVEAMVNGIPVIGSERGGIPETLGNSGIVLPLPDRLTPTTRQLPTAEEVAPWIDAVIRLWDDKALYDCFQRRALSESQRWSPEVLEPQYVRYFQELRAGSKNIVSDTPNVAKSTAVVAYTDEISSECDRGLQHLAAAGVRCIRRGGCTDLDMARNILLSEAIHDDLDAVLLLDPDTGFDHYDGFRLLARTEPVIAGICQKINDGQDKVVFDPEVHKAFPGHRLHGIYPVERAGIEFLRVRTSALRRMTVALDLPLCDTNCGRGIWPFFQPAFVSRLDGCTHYLGPVEAFYHRLHQAGITPLVDTSITLTPVASASPWARAATTWNEVPGMFDFALVYDDMVDKATDGAVFVEVGCLAGRSTCYLGSKIRESGKAIALYAVDTGRGSASDSTGQLITPAVGGSLAGVLHRNLIGCGLDNLVIPILTTSNQAAKLFQSNSVDFCFIDADHSYESVLGDLRAWWPKVKPGGFIAGHDYRQSAPWLVGVTPAVHHFFGVPNAAHPLCISCWMIFKPLSR